MTKRLFIFFIIISLITTSSIILLGINLAKQETVKVKNNFKTLAENRLQELAKLTNQVIQSKKISLSNLLQEDDYIHNLEKSPYVSNLVILDNNGELIYPKKYIVKKEPPYDSYSIRSKNFDIYQPDKKNDIIKGKFNPLGKEFKKNEHSYNAVISKEQNESSSLIGGTRDLEKEKEFRARIKDLWENNINFNQASENGIQAQEGFYIWYDINRLKFIFWKRYGSKIVGLELNQARMIADIIATLPTSSKKDEFFILKSATDTLYTWGKYKPKEGEIPLATTFLKNPIHSWSICYFSNHNPVTGNNIIFNYSLASVIISIVLFSVCYYFYKENQRSLIDAKNKISFINQVSHELKTPLTNICLYSELLEYKMDQELTDEHQKIDVIIGESQRLKRLIDNVLNFSNEEKNNLNLNKRSHNLNDIINSCINTFTPLLNKKNITIETKLVDVKPINIDEDAIKQILYNLLSNIEKYVPNNCKVIISSKQDYYFSFITVSDNGIGIKPKHRKKIFEPFYRICNSLTSPAAGSGIGLSISKKIAQLHKGDLSLIDSNKGATFQLKISNGDRNEGISS